jgi:alanine racemase
MIQIERFLQADQLLKDNGITVKIKHCANSAATILFPKTHFDMVRVGIASYGMWPSKETYVSYLQERNSGFELTPAFTWKAKIAQIKNVPAGEFIGYGCAFKTTHDTKLAIIPVGYYDGYDRGISNNYVLIHGKRAFLRGRVCMNMIMVDVTDIPEARLEDTVTLMGVDGEETITAEQFGTWAGTINYEVTTRVNDRILRAVV